MFASKIIIYFHIFIIYFGISLGYRHLYTQFNNRNYISIRDITEEDIIEIPDDMLETLRNFQNKDTENTSLSKKDKDPLKSDSELEIFRNIPKNKFDNSGLAKKDDGVLASYLNQLKDSKREPHHYSDFFRRTDQDQSPSIKFNRIPSRYASKQGSRRDDSQMDDQKNIPFVNQDDRIEDAGKSLLRSRVFYSPNLADRNGVRQIHNNPTLQENESPPIQQNTYYKDKRYGSFNGLGAVQEVDRLSDTGDNQKKSTIHKNGENRSASISSTMKNIHQMNSTENLPPIENNTLDQYEWTSNKLKTRNLKPIQGKISEIAKPALKPFERKINEKRTDLFLKNNNPPTRTAYIPSKSHLVSMVTNPNMFGVPSPTEKVENLQKKNLPTPINEIDPIVSSKPESSSFEDNHSKEFTSTNKKDIVVDLYGDFSHSTSRHKKALLNRNVAKASTDEDDVKIIVLVLGAMALASVFVLVGVCIVHQISKANIISENQNSFEEGPVKKQGICQRLRLALLAIFGELRRTFSAKNIRTKTFNDSQDRKAKQKSSIIRSENQTHESKGRQRSNDSYFAPIPPTPPHRHSNECNKDTSSVKGSLKSNSMPMLPKVAPVQKRKKLSDIYFFPENSKTACDFASLPSLPTVSSSSSHEGP